jgi:hypothetical protein
LRGHYGNTLMQERASWRKVQRAKAGLEPALALTKRERRLTQHLAPGGRTGGKTPSSPEGEARNGLLAIDRMPIPAETLLSFRPESPSKQAHRLPINGQEAFFCVRKVFGRERQESPLLLPSLPPLPLALTARYLQMATRKGKSPHRAYVPGRAGARPGTLTKASKLRGNCPPRDGHGEFRERRNKG